MDEDKDGEYSMRRERCLLGRSKKDLEDGAQDQETPLELGDRGHRMKRRGRKAKRREEEKKGEKCQQRLGKRGQGAWGERFKGGDVHMCV